MAERSATADPALALPVSVAWPKTRSLKFGLATFAVVVLGFLHYTCCVYIYIYRL